MLLTMLDVRLVCHGLRMVHCLTSSPPFEEKRRSLWRLVSWYRHCCVNSIKLVNGNKLCLSESITSQNKKHFFTLY